ncbi:MAG: YiiX/YebB-like N1pC/P60 family cysteine hydrolase [Gammaproteobacteria bacterium]|nr:YiiX/YebB-like N1pC/P60 family cysteine hydrolase [Gammaproteobacteria bacterium]
MAIPLYSKLRQAIIHWLTDEPPATETPPCDFDRLKHEIRPGDVLLIEGRSRVSHIIQRLTQSPWTHAALYIGRADDIEDDNMRRIVEQHQTKGGNVRLIIEGLLGKGMIVSPLSSYRHHHIRICRPIGLSLHDTQLVISYAAKTVGQRYNVRQLLDLARFLLPWSFLPRRWGSSLFTTPSGEPESGICSTMIAEAFTSVKFPILPFAKPGKTAEVELIHRNPNIFSPKDFDYSPYFEIIKYPIFNHGEQIPYYRRMPWTEEEIMHQGRGVFVGPKTKKRKTLSKWNPLRRRKKNVSNPDDSASFATIFKTKLPEEQGQ